MSSQRTRRDFMKLSTTGMALAGAVSAQARNPGDPGKPAGEIRVWVTAGSQRWAQAPSLQWQPAGGTSGAGIVLDPSRQFQEVLGFGAAFTDAACYVLSRMAAEARAALFAELFDPSGIGLSVFRTCLGSSDYSTKVYSYDDGEPDPEMLRFSIDHDRQYILPVIRQARQINPGLFLLGSPWSPPGWMKPNGSMLGGSMRKSHFASYAQYFVKFLQAYAAEGVPVQAITSQNEVDTDQDGKMPACLWGQEYEIEFVARHLGPQLAQHKLDTRIWILDHNYNLWGRAICELEDPEVNRYVDGVAWHGYAGQPDAMTRVHEAYPNKHMYWTEGGPDYRDPNYGTDWAKWSAMFAEVLRNWSRCIIAWNLALDEQGKPNIGPFTCGGVVTVNSQTQEVTRSGQYWALAHYSRAIRRGARRFHCTSQMEKVWHVAVSNPDGTSAMVLTNSGPVTNARLLLAGMTTDVPLPADSVVTLLWS
ncbi:MAG: glycoside hydrolase family 30 beta sandwich domain-containing protein [Bryobacteraceae bacterium]